MAKDTKHRLPKKKSAPRVLNEQFGAISIRCKLLATLEKGPLVGDADMVPHGGPASPQAQRVLQLFHGLWRLERERVMSYGSEQRSG